MRSRGAPLLCVVFFLLCASLLSAAESSYTIKAGETVFTVSKKSGIPVDVLLSYNSIPDASKLKIGTIIRVPTVYTVKKGDTLYGIAKKFSIPLAQLRSLNKLSASATIKAGDSLFIPKDAATVVAAAPDPAGSLPVGSLAAAGSQAAASQAPVAPTNVVLPLPGTHILKKSDNGAMWWLVFQGASGDVVRSATAGEVKWAATWWGYGKVLIIKGTDGSTYQYRGNRELLVNVGDRVSPGMEIARLGPSLQGGGTQLYFSINDAQRNPIDPEKFFSAKSQS